MPQVRDFRATEDGEWYAADGDFATVADADAVPQGVRIRVRMFLGECYLDESVGIPWLDKINIKNPDPLLVKALIGVEIGETPDVTNVVATDLVLDSATREASIAYTIDTVYSEEPLSGQALVP